MIFPDQLLVLGGAASGKSEIAEKLVLNSGRRPVYLATAAPKDQEMRGKILAHRARRDAHWRTVEEQLSAFRVIADCHRDEILLFECATLWLLNQMTAESDLEAETARLLDAIANAVCPIVTVSNEIGMGIVPGEAFSREFRTIHGRLNRKLAEAANAAILVVAGLPLPLKGSIPQ